MEGVYCKIRLMKNQKDWLLNLLQNQKHTNPNDERMITAICLKLMGLRFREGYGLCKFCHKGVANVWSKGLCSRCIRNIRNTWREFKRERIKTLNPKMAKIIKELKLEENWTNPSAYGKRICVYCKKKSKGVSNYGLCLNCQRRIRKLKALEDKYNLHPKSKRYLKFHWDRIKK